MPFDAFAQLEFPGQVVDRFPGCREARCDALFLVEDDQCIEKVHGK